MIQEAIEVYNGSFYAAATVLFLTQVEGVIYDLTAQSWTERQKEWLTLHLKALPREIKAWTDAVSCAFADVNASGEPHDLHSFNRNKIIHGLGTDINTPCMR